MKYTPKQLHDNVNVSRTSPLKELTILLVGALGIVFSIYITLGLLVDHIVPRLPSNIEHSLGAVFSQAHIHEKRTVEGQRTQRLLDDLVNSMEKKNGPYNIILVSDSILNAIALPGGNILVYSELLKSVESENELAFVLAHELGHFAHKDHLRGLGRGLVFMFISTVMFGESSIITDFISNSLINVEMKFSRYQESNADLWALDLLNRKYGHVAGAKDFIKRMAEMEDKSRIAYYFASHPFPQDRLNALENEIQAKGYAIKETTKFTPPLILNEKINLE